MAAPACEMISRRGVLRACAIAGHVTASSSSSLGGVSAADAAGAGASAASSLGVEGGSPVPTLASVLEEISPREDAVAGQHGGIMLPGPATENAEAYNTWAHVYLMALHDRYGDSFCMLRDGKPLVMVRSPEAVRQVLLSPDFCKTWDADEESSAKVDYVMNLVQPVLKHTVFNLHGDANAQRRKHLRPTFLAASVFVESFAAAVADEVASWPEGEIDMLAAAHDILRRNIMTAIAGDVTEYAHATLPVFHEVTDHFLRRYSVPMHDKVINDEDDRQMSRLADAGREIVAGFRALIRDTAGGDMTKLSDAQKRSVLGCMIRAGEYSDDEMAATLVNLLIAGGEAPASTLAHTLQELCHRPDIWAKLQVEADAALAPAAGKPAEVSAAVLRNMPYTDACAKEGLRLFAPATLVQRVATTDVEVAGVAIPKGTVVGVCVSAVHADPKQFPDPQTFIPDRANNNYVKLEQESSFVTFSNGPRGCPGRHVAVAAVRVALATIAQKFNIAPPASGTRTGLHTMVPKFIEWSSTGIPVAVSRRA